MAIKKAGFVSAANESKLSSKAFESSLNEKSSLLGSDAKRLSASEEIAAAALERRIAEQTRDAATSTQSDFVGKITSRNSDDGTYEVILSDGRTLSRVPNVNIQISVWVVGSPVTVVFVSGEPQITAYAVQHFG